MEKVNSSLICVVAAASIAACGGGGDSTTSGAPVAATPVQATAQLVTTVPAPTYAAGSEELLAFNYFNGERSRCGFGKLAQSVPLDKATKAHADYQLINNLLGHYQNAAQFPNGFTGVEPSDRVVFQGYDDLGQVTDEIDAYANNDNSKVGGGRKSIAGLLNAPYHAAGMLREYRDVGGSIRSGVDVGKPNGRVVAQYNLAYKRKDGAQDLPAGTISSYPCNGSVGIERGLYNETPNPVPGRNLRVSPLGSQSFFRAGRNDILEIISVKYAKKSDGELVPLRTVLTAKFNPNPDYLIGENEAIVLADTLMMPSTVYVRTTVLKLNGRTQTDIAEFTTGP